MLADFARRQHLTIRWVEVARSADLYPALLRGDGDLIASDLPPELSHADTLNTSVGMGAFRYVAYGRPRLAIEDPLGLSGQRVAISASSPLWPWLDHLRRTVPGVVPVVLPPATPRETLLRGVASGHFDVALVAVGAGETSPWPDGEVKELFAMSDMNPIVWYTTRSRSDLRDALNTYMQRFHTAVLLPQRAFGDLPSIHKRGRLRAITRIDTRNYFVRDGRPAGFEYEMVKWFAQSQGLDVEFVTADTDQQALAWLRAGRGDVITSRMRGDEVDADTALAQSRPYFHSATVLVGRSGTNLHDVQALAGKRVAVYANSVEHRVLSELVGSGLPVQPVVLNPRTPPAYVAEKLEHGAFHAAIVDASAIAGLRAFHPLIEAGTSLPSSYRYAWTYRRGDSGLGRAIERFVRGNFASPTYNVLAQRYFQQPQPASNIAALSRLSPYDNLVRHYADTYDFDWRLIVAQMYFESQFNPGAISVSGARGLMQLAPDTARALGIQNPCDPDAGIRGGVRYLDQLRGYFEQKGTVTSPGEQTWFALAAYNAGLTRVERAREIAAAQGFDPNRWFGSVETIMRRMDSGHVHGRRDQTVEYVRGIRSLYTTYNRQQETVTVSARGPATHGSLDTDA